MTVHANQVSLDDLLSAIGRQADVAIVQTPGDRVVREVKVTDSFSDVPIEQGISRLLQDSNYIMEIDGTKLKRVFILAAPAERPVGEMGHVDVRPTQSVIRYSVVGVSETGEQEESVPPGDQQESQRMATRVLKLHSANPEVRLAALATMRSEGARDTPLEDVRNLVEQDPDPRVQAAAFDLSVRRDTTDEWKHMLSRLAVQPDGLLHDAAAQALEQFRRDSAPSANMLPESDQ